MDMMAPKEGHVTMFMAGETGGTGRDLPLRAPLIPFPVWDPGGTQYITKWALFTSLGLFFSNCNSCIGGFSPFKTLGDPLPRGPQRPSPPYLSNHFSSPDNVTPPPRKYATAHIN